MPTAKNLKNTNVLTKTANIIGISINLLIILGVIFLTEGFGIFSPIFYIYIFSLLVCLGIVQLYLYPKNHSLLIILVYLTPILVGFYLTFSTQVSF